MKVLIMSCSTGEGHNSAGSAVREYFKSRGVHCDMINAFCFVSEVLSEVISKGHVFVYRNMPHLFGAGYKLEEKYPPKTFYRKMAKGANGLHTFIQSGGYDAVVCSHIFAAMMVTECRRRYGHEFKAYLLATDYTCSPGVNLLDMDGIFIPHELLRDEFESKGVDGGKLIAGGIPVLQKYFSQKPRDSSREEIGIAPGSDMVLLSCGSMGCGPMYELTSTLLQRLNHSVSLCVVCGNNQKLYEQLSELTRDIRLQLVGFTPKMFDYINSADVYITKPGGLSTTEAISRGVPLVFVDAVPGCETHNLRFMTKHGCALTAPDVDGVTEIVRDILKDKQGARTRFFQNQSPFVKNGALNVYNEVMNNL